ncbi:hypothetical protein [uncultured Arthrobacter sp.]|uniref:hypothetical protein n=1 Tax=uncultured Arthrobacter sp. TaxID=114050 RepID=UPI0028D434B7|nr:hypothetical protein [uncultured Arthrobacter sp.]
MGYLYVRPGLIDGLQPVVPGWKAARLPLENFLGPAMDLSPTASKLDASLAWFPARHRSSIVSVPVDDPDAVMARLREANVVVSVRAGRIRLATHFYNCEEELDRVAGLIAGR